jgi:hypothetical protein
MEIESTLRRESTVICEIPMITVMHSGDVMREIAVIREIGVMHSGDVMREIAVMRAIY